jgi:hypothetical protein
MAPLTAALEIWRYSRACIPLPLRLTRTNTSPSSRGRRGMARRIRVTDGRVALHFALAAA